MRVAWQTSPIKSLLVSPYWCQISLHIQSLSKFCSVLRSRIKYSVSARGRLLPSPSLIDSQTWEFNITHGLRFDSGEASSPHKIGEAHKDETNWKLIRGLRYSGSSHSSWLSLSSVILLYKEDFLRSVRNRCGLDSDRKVSFRLTTRRF